MLRQLEAAKERAKSTRSRRLPFYRPQIAESFLLFFHLLTGIFAHISRILSRFVIASLSLPLERTPTMFVNLLHTVVPTTTPDRPPLFDPALPPSPSLLFYLFAERRVSISRWGTKTPVAGVRVNTNKLAGALLAVAFWNLRNSGRVHLEPARDSLRVTLASSAKGKCRNSAKYLRRLG